MYILNGKRLMTAMLGALLLTAGFCGQAGAVSDKDLTNMVEQAYNIYSQVKVESKDGQVTLTGTVPTEKAHANAGLIAGNIPGVNSVINNIEVKTESAQTISQYIDDTAITTAVKSKLLLQKDISSLDISVATLNGVVTLSGQVEHSSQATLAEIIAVDVEGVKFVVNKLAATAN